MIDMITLNAGPHRKAKAYIAKIKGTASGAVKYDREFLGNSADIVEGDEGLYEKQTGKHGHRWYHVVLWDATHGLIMSNDCENDLRKIAKLLDQGYDIHDAVEPVDLSEPDDDGVRIFNVKVRTAAEIKRHQKAQAAASKADVVGQIKALMAEHGVTLRDLK